MRSWIFLEDAVGDHVLAVGELERGHGLDRRLNGEAAQLVDVPPPDGHGQGLGLEAGALALGAVDLAHEPLDLFARPVRLRLAVAALQPRDDALVLSLVGALAVEAVLVGDVHRLGAGAVEDQLLVLGLERLPWGVEGEPAEVGHAHLEAREVLAAGSRPRARAPSASDRVSSGTTSSGSTSNRVPRPRHTGQAPYGELKEKFRGAGSSKLMPQWVHARCCEKVMASSPSPSPSPPAPPFMTRTSAVPPVSARAVSIDSVRRWRMLSRRTRRSTTTSMVCIS